MPSSDKSCNIRCDVINYNPELKETVRDWEVTPEGRVWPCCFFGNAYDKRHSTHQDETQNPNDSSSLNTESATLFDDPIMAQLLKDDPDWNNLEHHTLEEIINHNIYQSYIYYKGWESDNPPHVCARNCSTKINSKQYDNTRVISNK
tara:strand:+ start:2487 stop:2927 length:441 start_codon:yes stop_codon:yes gene_type:complete